MCGSFFELDRMFRRPSGPVNSPNHLEFARQERVPRR